MLLLKRNELIFVGEGCSACFINIMYFQAEQERTTALSRTFN